MVYVGNNMVNKQCKVNRNPLMYTVGALLFISVAVYFIV
jgi:hypothetical protein